MGLGKLHRVVLCFSVSSVVSCVTQPVREITLGDLGNRLTKLEEQHEFDKRQGLSLFSPGYFEAAGHSLQKAREAEKMNRQEVLLNETLTAENALDRAHESQVVFKSVLRRMVNARIEARSLLDEAARLEIKNIERWEKKYIAADKFARALASQVEERREEQALGLEARGVRKYQEISSAILKRLTLDPVKKVFRDLKSEKSQRWAREATEKARETFNKTEALIRKNPEMRDEIRSLGKVAMLHAKRALRLTVEAKGLESRRLASLAPIESKPARNPSPHLDSIYSAKEKNVDLAGLGIVKVRPTKRKD